MTSKWEFGRQYCFRSIEYKYLIQDSDENKGSINNWARGYYLIFWPKISFILPIPWELGEAESKDNRLTDLSEEMLKQHAILAVVDKLAITKRSAPFCTALKKWKKCLEGKPHWRLNIQLAAATLFSVYCFYSQKYKVERKVMKRRWKQLPGSSSPECWWCHGCETCSEDSCGLEVKQLRRESVCTGVGDLER